MKGLTLNTLITSGTGLMVTLIGLLIWDVFQSTKSTHEAVSVIQATMVTRVEMEKIKADLAGVQHKQIELQNRQDAMSLDIARLRKSSTTTPKTP